MLKKILPRIILVVWVIMWAIFLVRPFFKKDLGREYITLFTLSAEGKRAYILGNDLNRFINFCQESLQAPSTYRIEGINADSIDQRRAKYYLYPNREDKEPEFILVYKMKNYSEKGYSLFKRLDSEDYILRKTG